MSRPLGVVVPTWHGGDLVRRCITSLRAQTRPADRVVVIAADPHKTEDFQADVLRPGRRVHYGEAANLGFSHLADHDCVVLNDDTWAEPGFLAALDAARDDRHLLQPRILLGDDGRLDNIGHGVFPDGFGLARGRGAADGPRFDAAGTAGAVSGAAFLIPRPVLAQLGGFDVHLGPYAEDLDLSLRAARLGTVVRTVPSARIHHQLGASYGRTGFQKLYAIERNHMRAAIRSLPAGAVLALPALTLARWGALAVTGAGSQEVPIGAVGALAAFAGALAGLRHAPEALRKRSVDRGSWTVHDREMWAFLTREGVRWSDLKGDPRSTA